VFLFEPGAGFPGLPSVPVALGAVSAARLASGDGHFVVAGVRAAPLRLWGLLDVNGDFDPAVDVLAQPTAGDLVARRGVALEVQASVGGSASLALEVPVSTWPPAFSLDPPAADVQLDAPAGGFTTLTLAADPGPSRGQAPAFTLTLVDADGDGLPDDADGDGAPDLSLRVLLHLLPTAGLLAEMTIVVPALLDPAPFRGALQGRLDASVSTARLAVTVIPVALELLADGTTQVLGAPPRGDYELLALGAGGQFWRLPNQLAATTASQAPRLHYDRADP
jgi:hypothetical protein